MLSTRYAAPILVVGCHLSVFPTNWVVILAILLELEQFPQSEKFAYFLNVKYGLIVCLIHFFISQVSTPAGTIPLLIRIVRLRWFSFRSFIMFPSLSPVLFCPPLC